MRFLFMALSFRNVSGSYLRNLKHCKWFSTKPDTFPQRLVLPDNHGYVPILTNSQINTLLETYETSLSNASRTNHVIEAYHSNQLASNSPSEDRRAQARLLHTDGALFGVFDGHAGPACAQAIGERLYDYIATMLLTPDQLEQFNHSLKTDGNFNLIQRHLNNNDYFNDDMQYLHRMSLHKLVIEKLSSLGFEEDEYENDDIVSRNLIKAFEALDCDIGNEALPKGGTLDFDALEVSISGACACVAHVDNLSLRIANIGDCRAVLGQKQIDGSWSSQVLTNDHAATNIEEYNRVMHSHPVNEQTWLLRNDRLLGALIPLRAFGDFRFKWSIEHLKSIKNILSSDYADNVGLIPYHYKTPPYLISRPEMTYHKLTPQDKFIVLASDGLWEQLSNEDVIQLVGEFLESRDTSERYVPPTSQSITLGEINKVLSKRKAGLAIQNIDQNVATHLIRCAIGHGHKKISEMLTLPSDIVRYYRDDITVTVIFFNSQYIQELCNNE